MPYANGTANSADELREAIRSFATRTLASYDDLFGGSLGLSAFGTGNYSVLGLRHRQTQGVILFDVVEGPNMHNEAGEHVLLGQLLSTALGAVSFDPNRYYGEEGVALFRVEPGSTITRTTGSVTRSGGSEQFDETTFVASVGDATDGGGEGPFTNMQLAQAIVVQENYTDGQGATFSHHVFEVHELTDIEEGSGAYTQTVKAEYVGSYNESNATSSASVTVTDGSTDSDDHLLSNFSARDTELLRETKFNEFTTNMWLEYLTTDEIADGYYPRSGRLDFSTGVEYEFFGDGTTGNDHFHMVLNNVGSDRVTHWWTGRVSAPAVSMTEPGQSPTTIGTEMTTADNSNGLFLGTSGPHTDEYGVDTYQYPFSFKAADEAWKNPCAMVTTISDDGANSTIRQQDGGRNSYGPTGANHKNKYGPNETVFRLLQSARYSIQSGLNGFAGGNAEGMHGARGRTYYPLRPNSYTDTSGPVNVVRFDGGEQYLQPWAPAEAILYSAPMTSDHSGVTGSTADPAKYAVEIEAGLPDTPAGTQGTTSMNADGWAEQTLPDNNNDPQAVFWGESTLSPTYTTTAYDRIEFRVRLKTPAVGGTAFSTGEYFFSTGTVGFGSGGQGTFEYPSGFSDGEWTTFSLDPQTTANTPANWYDTGTSTSHNVDGFRIDVLRYSSAPTTGAVLEWDYIMIGQTKVQRDSVYQGSDGSYFITLGQLPGVSRVTMEPSAVNVSKRRSKINIEGDTYVSIEASKFNTESGTGNGLARPQDPTIDSGLAGYVYKR